MSFWDEMYRTGQYFKHWDYQHPSQELVATLAALALPPGSQAVDVGCGAGREAVFLAECGFKVCGVDISEEALAMAKARAVGAGVDVDWKKGSAMQIPLPDHSVDFANDRGCFHHIPASQRPRYASELARVMKVGARLLLRGCREDGGEDFVLVKPEDVEEFFVPCFSHGPVLPITLVSNSGTLSANLVLLTRT